MLTILIFLSYLSIILCKQSYIEFFNSCSKSSIKISYSIFDDPFNAEYSTILASTNAAKSEEFDFDNKIFYWMYKAQGEELILNGSFTFHTSGGNALGYIVSDDSNCYPIKIELNSTYIDKSTIVFINAAKTSKDAYVSTNKNDFINYGNILPNPPNNYLVSNNDINSEMHDVTIQFSDSNDIVNSDLLDTVYIPPDSSLFSLNYYIKQDKWGILMFSALGI
jgi:hypothetical protein